MPSRLIPLPARSRLARALAVALLPLACNGEGVQEPPRGGQISIITNTAGTAQDPDGYVVSLDDGAEVPIGVNTNLTISAEAGPHTVELRGVAETCRLEGSARREVAVVADRTVQVLFRITCALPVGGLTVTTTTSGGLPDADGYAVRVDDGDPQPIPGTGSLTVEGLAVGPHTVLLEGVAGNCAIEGDNPQQVEIAVDAVATVAFTITCTGPVQRWTPLAVGTTADFTDLWGASASDMVVVGERDTDRGVESVILRFDGTSWVPAYTEDDMRLRGLWGSGPNDIYAVGFGFLESRARVLHWDGAEWSVVPGFEPLGFEELGLLSIWGSSPSDIFAVGFTFVQGFELSLVYHFDGTRWERMLLGGDVVPSFADVWGSSPTDVYAVGRDDLAPGFSGVIMRYDGVTWSEVLRGEGLALNGIWGSSANDVFAAGFQVEEVGDDFLVNGAVWHFDGTQWSPMTLPEVGVLQEIWGSSASDVYAIGDDGLILHYDGTTWTPQTVGENTLLGIWGAPPGDVFAAGLGGTILRGTR